MQRTGFTLIETVITAALVTCGLIAVAAMFSVAIRTNIANRQSAAATALLYDKMEQFKAASADDPLWADGTGFDEVTLDSKYRRVWEIPPTFPRTVTIIVYASDGAATRRETELIRATAVVSDTFQ